MVRRAAIVAAVQQGQRQRLRRKLGALETSLVKDIQNFLILLVAYRLNWADMARLYWSERFFSK